MSYLKVHISINDDQLRLRHLRYKKKKITAPPDTLNDILPDIIMRNTDSEPGKNGIDIKVSRQHTVSSFQRIE